MATYQEMTKKIQDEFLSLYNEKSIHQITVKELCDSVNIPRTSFYNYFSDIFEVLESIEDQLIIDLSQINSGFAAYDLHGCNRENFDFFTKTLEYIVEHEFWFKVLLNKNRDGHFIYKWKKIIKRDFSEKYFMENIQLENEPLKLEMIASGCIGAYIYWINNFSHISKDVIAKEVLFALCQDFF